MTSAPVLLLLASLSAAFIMIGASTLPQTPPAVKCGNDKVYNFCGTACPLNCTHTEPVACPKICSSRCFCKKGFVELGESCIEKEKCESCTGNTTYTTCGTACPTTCKNRFNKSSFCTLQCMMGCECKSGYVLLDEKKKTCVLPKDCPMN